MFLRQWLQQNSWKIPAIGRNLELRFSGNSCFIWWRSWVLYCSHIQRFFESLLTKESSLTREILSATAKSSLLKIFRAKYLLSSFFTDQKIIKNATPLTSLARMLIGSIVWKSLTIFLCTQNIKFVREQQEIKIDLFLSHKNHLPGKEFL